MIAKDKLLQLSNLHGSHKAGDHFINSGEIIYIRDDFKGNLDKLTTNANLLVNDVLNANIDITDVSLLVEDNVVTANIENINFKGELHE